MIPVAAAGAEGGRPEDRVAVARSSILDLGTARFGPLPVEVVSTIRDITDLDRLKRIAMQLLTATSWQELLKTK